METFRGAEMFTLLSNIALLFIISLGFRRLTRSAIARYNADLVRTYFELFEERTSVARLVHPTITQNIELSKALIYQVATQEGSRLQMIDSMRQVSEWLEQATKGCDRALKALEESSDKSPQRDFESTEERLDPAKGTYVGPKAHSRHDC